MRTLYFDCFAGASGNMILGALIAAGVDPDALKTELEKLELPDFELKIEKVDRSGISAKHVVVEIPDEKKHRHLPEIQKIIAESTLSDTVKDRALSIFRRLAEAEAKVHGIEIEKVHFHEVGALDAIIDIVGSCIGFEILGIEKFASTKIHVGSGFVQMAHGKFPVPPPAVAELLRGVPIYSTEIEGELITPTGAAIITTLANSYGILSDLKTEVIGYGAGTRKYDAFPNVLRLLIGESELQNAIKSASLNIPTEEVTLLETNIDDISPQIIGYVMDRAFDLGALDCWFTPIQMKKNRPAVLLSVLCKSDMQSELAEMIFSETTTIGIRVSKTDRLYLEREMTLVKTEYGDIPVKIARMNGKIVNSMPEYEDVRRTALEKGVAFRIVLDAAKRSLETAAKSVAR